MKEEKTISRLSICFDLIKELVLRDTTNAECKSESSPTNSVQKRQQKKKKRRTADSYSDISFNDKYKLTEELLGTGAHGYVKKIETKNNRFKNKIFIY
jgi:hypothetical protein